jgi:hypothetical protein
MLKKKKKKIISAAAANRTRVARAQSRHCPSHAVAHFSVDVVLYCSIVPAIWILELKTNRRAVLCLYIELIQSSLGLEKDAAASAEHSQIRSDEILKSNILLDIMQVQI